MDDQNTKDPNNPSTDPLEEIEEILQEGLEADSAPKETEIKPDVMEIGETSVPQETTMEPIEDTPEEIEEEVPDEPLEPAVDRMGLEVMKVPINKKVTRTSAEFIKLLVIAAVVLALVGGGYFAFTTYSDSISGIFGGLKGSVTTMTDRFNRDSAPVIVDETSESTETPAETSEEYSVFGELLRRYVSF